MHRVMLSDLPDNITKKKETTSQNKVGKVLTHLCRQHK